MKKAALLLLVLIVPSVAYIVLTTGKHNIRTLGYYGQKYPGETEKDTIYHSIQPFSLTDENGNVFGDNQLENKIYVANFFSTNCKTCPELQTLMKSVHDVDDFEKLKDLHFVSFSTDPQDSPENLKRFSNEIKADSTRWHFLSGPKDAIYNLGLKSFMVDLTPVNNQPGQSDLIFLIDRKKHIRGIYEGRSQTDVKRLIDETKVLIAEYNLAKKKNLNPVK